MADVDVDTEPRLLFQQGKSIRYHFTALGSALVDEDRQLYADAASSLANINDRFFLWASNVGLFNPSHASLDYQLRDNEHVRTFTNDLLLTLDGLLQKVEEIVTGLRMPYEALDSNSYVELENTCRESNGSDTSGEDFTGAALSIDSGTIGSDVQVIFGGVDVDNNESEAELLIQQMGSVVDQLFSIALQIRNPITRKILTVDRIDLHRHIHPSFRDQYIQMRAKMEYQGLLQVFQQCRRESTRTKDTDSQPEDAIDDDDKVLIHRLLQANRIRRCRFHYWKRYKIKSTRFTSAMNDPDHDQLPAPSMPCTAVNRPSTTALSVKQSELSHQISSRLTSAIPVPAAFVLNDNIAPSSKSSRASTSLETSPDGLAVHWPTPPGGFYSSRKTQDFECPYCFFFCSSRTAKMEAWKNHLRFDLLPYQCTYPQCNEADTLFDNFDSWNLHEQRAHRRIWVCHIDQAQFAEKINYEEHVRDVHSDKASVLLTPELISFRESTSKDCGRPCPVCLKGFQTSIDLQRHLARHLESIALLSLPAEEQEDQSASQEKSSDQSRVAERRPFMIARSIANDFPKDDGKPLTLMKMKIWTTLLL